MENLVENIVQCNPMNFLFKYSNPTTHIGNIYLRIKILQKKCDSFKTKDPKFINVSLNCRHKQQASKLLFRNNFKGD